MNLSLNWLSDYVAHGLTADGLADTLTHVGLEVEGVETTGPTLGGVVVGHVLSVAPHPDADRLRVCQVDLGTADGPVQIVCGAPNVAAGQKVPVATVGTELMLPARDGSGLAPVTIKKGKIRGEASVGMICAEDELGLGTGHDGILVLDEDADTGRPFADYLAERGDLPGDAVLDVSITPNRPDATSHVGMARDVAAVTGQPLRLPKTDVPPVGGAVAEAVRVTIEVPDDCPRFVGMVVRGVTVGESPTWLQERLTAVGLRPISNVVDVTHFVMLELGQPLHAYDLDRIADARVVVKKAAGGETFTTLDGTERTLPAGTVMVADGAGYVGIAGIMGGANSEVSAATTDVFIEGAYWEPSAIRRAARLLGMATDASYRFERGVDPTGQPAAVARAAALIAELGGGTIVDGRIDENPRPYAPRTVRLRPSRVRKVLGAAVPESEIARLLAAIGFGVEREATGALDVFAETAMRETGVATAAKEAAETYGLTLTVPPWRPDVAREIDAIEEVARLWGFEKLPQPARIAVPLVPAGDTPSARRLDATRRRLAALGVREIYANSLVPLATAEHFADAGWSGRALPPVETLHPISQDMAALRPSLLPGLLAAASYNAARGAASLRLMESGTVYGRAVDQTAPIEGYHEHTALGLAITGLAAPQAWDAPARDVDFYDLKGLVAAVLDGLGITGVTETPRLEPDALTDYALVLSVGETRLGVVARVSAAVTPDLSQPLFAAELDWDAVAALAPATTARYAPFARVPAVERDLAVVVPQAQAAGPLLDTIRDAGRPLLQSVRLFDRYRGAGVPEGQQSLAFALRFAADRTLTDQEIDGRMRRITGALERLHGATLRS